ncbi:MAG TPA: flavin reductase family protein [Gaiellaceae bacterium]
METLSLDIGSLTRLQISNLVHWLVAPRPIAWVSTVGGDGRPNLAPFSFFNVFASHPPTVGVGPGSRNGVNKDSLRNIRETGELTISVVTAELATRVNRTSAELDPTVSEWELAGVTPRESVTVRPASVAESPAALECRVFTIVDLGPDDLPTNSLVIARVTHMHVSEEVVVGDGYELDPAALDLVARMGGNLWCTTRERFELIRPTVEEATAELAATRRRNG